MTTKRTNVSKLERATDSKSLDAVLKVVDTNKVRDPYILFDWQESEGQNFQAGYAILYPGCRTGGHEHTDVEEVYYVVNGSGVMHVGNDSFDVGPGDTWIVPRYQFHWTENPGNTPLEMFWILVKI